MLRDLSLAKSACRRHYEYVLPAFAFDPAACQSRSRTSAGRATRPTPGNNAASNIRDQRTAAAMRGFVFDEACRARLSGILYRFCGTHSYHNFTVKVRKCLRHASLGRHQGISSLAAAFCPLLTVEWYTQMASGSPAARRYVISCACTGTFSMLVGCQNAVLLYGSSARDCDDQKPCMHATCALTTATSSRDDHLGMYGRGKPGCG